MKRESLNGYIRVDSSAFYLVLDWGSIWHHHGCDSYEQHPGGDGFGERGVGEGGKDGGDH